MKVKKYLVYLLIRRVAGAIIVSIYLTLRDRDDAEASQTETAADVETAGGKDDEIAEGNNEKDEEPAEEAPREAGLADKNQEEALQEEMKDKEVPEETPPQEETAGVQKKPEKKKRKKKIDNAGKQEKEKSDKDSPGTEDDGQIALEF